MLIRREGSVGDERATDMKLLPSWRINRAALQFTLTLGFANHCFEQSFCLFLMAVGEIADGTQMVH